MGRAKRAPVVSIDQEPEPVLINPLLLSGHLSLNHARQAVSKTKARIFVSVGMCHPRQGEILKAPYFVRFILVAMCARRLFLT